MFEGLFARRPGGGSDVLGPDFDPRFNNFDACRFFLAAAVLFSHSFALLIGDNSSDPLYRLTSGRTYLGEMAVNSFFIISGYLIVASWLNSQGLFNFLRKRVLRIDPGFIVVCLLCAFVVAPLGGGLAHEIFTLRNFVNVLIRTVAMAHLPAQGAFAGVPFPDELNGSLWTIRYEFICYLLVAVIGLTIGYARRWVVVTLLVASIAAYAVQLHWLGAKGSAWLQVGGFQLTILGNLFEWPRFLACFMTGAAFMLFRQQIRLDGRIAVGCAVALLVAWRAGIAWAVLMPLCLMYLLMYIAYTPRIPLQKFGSRGDISYGIYLYAWPVQQLLEYSLGSYLTPWTLFLASLTGTATLAAMSWYFVEKPFLQSKSRQPKRVAAPASPPPLAVRAGATVAGG